MDKTKLFQAPTELEAPLVSKREGQVIHISLMVRVKFKAKQWEF